MIPEDIHIACSCDENMVMAAAAMLKSLFVNLPAGRQAKVYVLDGGIAEHSKNRLLRSIKPHADAVRFIRVNEKPLEGMEVSGHINLTSYYRFLIPSLLPPEIKKVIYLDLDLIVHCDITELWEAKMGAHYLLAVPEQGKSCLYVSSPDGLLNYKALGLKADQKQFNSGVLVIDLEKWRNGHISVRLVDYIRQNRHHVRWHDQDALNSIFASRWGELDYRWNVLTQLFSNSPWHTGPVKDKKAYCRLVRHPRILHFNTASKPWHAKCEHPQRQLFFRYLDMTDWKGWRPEKFYAYELLKFIKGMRKRIRKWPRRG
ncbi:MAG TPA: glycosyltransferase family 8 protein [Patescibacteria group bacterium]|nr:glycosyltransferase family 8 protein [Patescibacteria group bacterium]